MKKLLIYSSFAVLSALFGAGVYQWQQPDFVTIDGKPHHWRNLENNWLVVNYFAEWCAPCLEEVPELNEFSSRYDIPLFAISYDEEPDAKMQSIAKKYQMQFPIISAEPEPTMPFDKPAVLPGTFILDDKGKVRKVIKGKITHQSLYAAIKKLQSL